MFYNGVENERDFNVKENEVDIKNMLNWVGKRVVSINSESGVPVGTMGYIEFDEYSTDKRLYEAFSIWFDEAIKEDDPSTQLVMFTSDHRKFFELIKE